jgi:peptide/nickel transport system substrate-binding protein
VGQRPDWRSTLHRRGQAESTYRGPRNLTVAWVALAIVAAAAAAVAYVLATPFPVASQRYVEGVVEEAPVMMPVAASRTRFSRDVFPLVFAGLVRLDESGEARPDVAVAWNVSDDGRTYTFNVRQGVKWHDGHPLTADDVAFTVGLLRQQSELDRDDDVSLWRAVVTRVLDPATISFGLPEPLASFPDHLSFPLVPRHVLEGTSSSALPTHPFARAPIGLGPYRVVDHTPTRLTLERWGAFHGDRPLLDAIEFRFFGSPGTARAAFVAAEIDGVAQVPPELAGRLASVPGTVLYTFVERSKTVELVLNLRAEPLADRSVRQAIGRAIDRRALIADALDGWAEPAAGPFAAGSWAFARPPHAVATDPAGASALLDRAGWARSADGARSKGDARLGFEVLADDAPERLAVAREIARQLGEIGLSVAVRPMAGDELDAALAERRFVAAVVGQWEPGLDPDVYARWHSSQVNSTGANLAGLADPDIDRWLESGRTLFDRDGRLNAYLHFQSRWHEEQPSVHLLHPLHTFAVRDHVHGVDARPRPDSSWRTRDMTRWRISRPLTGREQAAAWLRSLLGLGSPADVATR